MILNFHPKFGGNSHNLTSRNIVTNIDAPDKTDWMKAKTRNPISKVNLSNKFFIDFCINETVANLERVFSIYQHEYTVVIDHLWRHTTPF